MVRRIRASNPRRLNKGRGLKLCVSSWARQETPEEGWRIYRPHHATSHLPSRLESQLQSVPVYDEECGDPLVQSGGRWKTLGVAAELNAGPQVQRDRRLASGVLQLCTLPSMPPSSPDLNPLDYFVWSYVDTITNMTSDNTKACLIADIHRVFAGLLPALVKEACSQFRIRIEAVIDAEDGYIE